MINTREVASEYRLSHWSQVMQNRIQSGLSIKDFCKRIEICQNTYYYWQRRVRAAACERLTKLEPAQKADFTEIMIVEPSVSLSIEETAAQLRIEVAGVKITADNAYPTERLAALLRELVGSC